MSEPGQHPVEQHPVEQLGTEEQGSIDGGIERAAVPDRSPFARADGDRDEPVSDRPGQPAAEEAAAATSSPRHTTGFLPSEPPRRAIESAFVRVVATLGVIGIGTLLGALLVANDVAGWIVGLTVSAVSVVLAAVLWRSREL